MAEQSSSPRFMRPRVFLIVLVAFGLGLTITPPQSVRSLTIQKAVQETPLQDHAEVEYADIVNQTRTAEKVWKQGSGYLWLQHARKAGGTTLCMTLRDNTKGLIRASAEDFTTLQERETCQITSLCSDCDLKKRFPYQESLEPIVRTAMQKAGRNMFEAEGFGVPTDILSHRWSDYVFISSIRHPMARIESSLRNDLQYHYCRMVPNTSSCLSKYVGSDSAILKECDKSIYNCMSNYLVRMFSGMERNYTNDFDMLERAKRNWHRFSCVVLQEEWSRTEHCLGERLGLYRHSKVMFNVNGNLTAGVLSSHVAHVELLQKEDYARLVSLNRADFEFYEWAREQILQSSNVYNGPFIPKS